MFNDNLQREHPNTCLRIKLEASREPVAGMRQFERHVPSSALLRPELSHPPQRHDGDAGWHTCGARSILTLHPHARMCEQIVMRRRARSETLDYHLSAQRSIVCWLLSRPLL